jgi:diadenosine tetraphosphate (Ap4A) HIT family hydrolase
MSSCPFCEEIDGAEFKGTNTLVSTKEVIKRVHASTNLENIRAFPDRAPVASPHILLCSKQHLTSFVSASKTVLNDLSDSVQELCYVANDYMPILIFEHGIRRAACSGCENQVSCADHAHLHLTISKPHAYRNITKLLQESSIFKFLRQGTSIEEIYSISKKELSNKEYIVIGMQGSSQKISIFEANFVPTQYIKRHLLSQGSKLLWNVSNPQESFWSSMNYLATCGWKKMEN